MRPAKTVSESIALMLLMTGPAVLADGITASVSGYGTAGGSFTSNGNYAYIRNNSEFSGASNSFDVGLDSRVGVQAVVTFDPQWSMTVQEEAKQRGTDSFDPGTEWLYVQYEPVSDLRLRIGRVVLPVFLVSDTIDVGYAVPWFHAPNDVYASEVFDHLDGAQAMWQHSLGPVELNLEVTFGDTTGTFQLDGFQLDAQSKSSFNAAIALSWRNLMVRYAETDLRIGVPIPLSATDIINLNLHDHFHCVGLQYDDGKALLISEWTKRDENNLPGLNVPLEADTTWYAAGGWRFGKFTPLAMYSAYNVGASELPTARSRYGTWSGSLRYDVVRNLDLKLQVTRPQASNGFYWVAPTAADTRINVYSLGADFVF